MCRHLRRPAERAQGDAQDPGRPLRKVSNLSPSSFHCSAHRSLAHSIAAAYSVPVLAATIAFVTYTATAHEFDVAIIFASLSLFQLLRQPLMFLPRALSATTDAQNALVRLTRVFRAETRGDAEDAVEIDQAQKHALEVRGATFVWEESAAAADVLGNPVKKEKEKNPPPSSSSDPPSTA